MNKDNKIVCNLAFAQSLIEKTTLRTISLIERAENIATCASKQSSQKQKIQKKQKKQKISKDCKKPLILAMSGGLDSVFLATCIAAQFDSNFTANFTANFANFPNELNLRKFFALRTLSICHINHKLRGAESDADEEFCRDFAVKVGASFFTYKFDVEVLAKRNKLSLEHCARICRRSAYRHLACTSGATCVLLGHTLDDQAESVLHHILRGSGSAGTAGMREISFLENEADKIDFLDASVATKIQTQTQTIASEQFAPEAKACEKNVKLEQEFVAENQSKKITLVRPILTIGKDEIRHSASALGVRWREDRSNADMKFTRNRLRAKLLPTASQIYGRDVRGALARFAKIQEAENELIADLTTKFFAERQQSLRKGRKLELENFLRLPLALRREAGRCWLEAQCGFTPNFREVEELLSIAKPQSKRARVNLRKNFQVYRREGVLGMRLQDFQA